MKQRLKPLIIKKLEENRQERQEIFELELQALELEIKARGLRRLVEHKKRNLKSNRQLAREMNVSESYLYNVKHLL